jgi:hypothetical protein
VKAPPSRRGRLLRYLVGFLVAGVLLVVNVPTVASFAINAIHDYTINTPSYKQREGHWSILPVPSKFRINAVHAALLYTGKVLIVAGSGNDRGDFEAGKFKSLVWNPANNKFKLIHTPSDMFCGGHAFLPDGKLLIAGGTSRYELLENQVTRAGGVMTVTDESPDGGAIQLPAGAEFASPTGIAFRSTEATTIPPARKVRRANGVTEVTASTTELWVEALNKGRSSVIKDTTKYAIQGLKGNESRTLFGIATSLTMEKQNFWASNKSYLFNPATEAYEHVSNLTLARWYPSLVGLKDGRVLAVSGLNQFGQIIEGENEIYTPATKTWRKAPQLKRTFPTYPALFLMPSGNLFYTSGNAGFGDPKVGRTPGIWDLSNNTFKIVPGLRDPDETETSSSLLLPPAQAQKYMIIGGGGVGQSQQTTARTAVADLDRPNPRFEPGPNLGQPTRYPSAVIAPNNEVIITGGSRLYRGEHNSDIFECHAYNPQTNKLSKLAESTVGRDYHSEALLLPDGRIVTLGGNPLYGNAEDTAPGTFEQRIEIYSPPYLYHGARPVLTGGPSQVTRGATALFTAPHPEAITAAELIRPSAVTHVTNSEQRSIALKIRREAGAIQVTIPTGAGLVPTGYYMLFVTNKQATPSVARWVHVS